MPGERRERLAALARQMQRWQTRRRGQIQRCPSGLAVLDEALGGGFARGSVHELLAPSGGVALSVALLAAARAVERAAEAPGLDSEPRRSRNHRVQPAARPLADARILYIDVSGDFYPPAAAQRGFPLSRLIVVHAPRMDDALWACEQTLRCPAVAAVVLSAPCSTRRIAAWTQATRRLQLAAESGQGLGLLVRPVADGPTFAASRMRFDPIAPSATGATGAESSASDALRARVCVLKLREARPAASFEIELPLLPAAARGGAAFASLSAVEAHYA